MSMVEAGVVTGKFFIPLGNIHYRATWQELKDFVRNADPDHPINIEHAHIYEPNRGFGWVSILGESDFWKAYNLLNGATFPPGKDSRGNPRGICLQAWDGNHHMAISLLKHPFEKTPPRIQSTTLTQLPPTPEWQRDSEPGPLPKTSGYCPPLGGAPYITNPYPMSPPITSYVVQPQQVPVAPNYSPVITYSQRPQYDIQYSNTLPLGPTYPSAYTPSAAVTTSYFPLQPQAPSPYYLSANRAIERSDVLYPSALASEAQQQQQQQQPQYIPLAQRSIFINRVPKSATAAQVYDLIHKIVATIRSQDSDDEEGDDDTEDGDDVIEKLELPRYGDNTRRGHAILTLRKESVARTLIEVLDGIIWKGERLSVRWDKGQPVEGSSLEWLGTGSGPKSRGSGGVRHREGAEEKDERNEGSESGSTACGEEKREPMSPVVADSRAWNENLVIRSSKPQAAVSAQVLPSRSSGSSRGGSSRSKGSSGSGSSRRDGGAGSSSGGGRRYDGSSKGRGERERKRR